MDSPLVIVNSDDFTPRVIVGHIACSLFLHRGLRQVTEAYASYIESAPLIVMPFGRLKATP